MSRLRTTRTDYGTTALMLVLIGLPAGHASATEPESTLPSLESDGGEGWSLALDNDLLAWNAADRDYTGGLSLTLSRRESPRFARPLDAILQRVITDAETDRTNASLDTIAPASTTHYALQWSLQTFTPEDLARSEIDRSDRPYASLWSVALARHVISPDRDRVRYAQLTLGVLGLAASGRVHRAVHRVTGGALPSGYVHQISAGGEPTARLVVGQSRLHRRYSLGSRLDIEAKDTWEASLGYLTDLSYALTLRTGSLATSWWTHAPERVDYGPQALALPRRTRAGRNAETYVWGGIKLRARAWNAFQQGQFRASAHRLDRADLQPLIGEAWLGLTHGSRHGLTLSYALRYQTRELRVGPGARDALWGGLTISYIADL